jgi:hypothetical protein
MKYVLLFFALIFGSQILLSQGYMRYDTAKVAERTFDQKSIQNLKRDKDFQYDSLREPAENVLQRWWNSFWLWFWSKVNAIMQTKKGRITFYTVSILLAAAVLVFFVMKVMGLSSGSIFGRNTKNGLAYSISDDDIHKISFDEAIQNAVDNGNYRLALRLLYLQSLKNLSDRGYINWAIDKTNRDYINEVATRPWFGLFKMLTHTFEYAWYGEMNVERDNFQRLQLQFQQFNNQL